VENHNRITDRSQLLGYLQLVCSLALGPFRLLCGHLGEHLGPGALTLGSQLLLHQRFLQLLKPLTFELLFRKLLEPLILEPRFLKPLFGSSTFNFSSTFNLSRQRAVEIAAAGCWPHQAVPALGAITVDGVQARANPGLLAMSGVGQSSQVFEGLFDAANDETLRACLISDSDSADSAVL
jgi:hypothetical protein